MINLLSFCKICGLNLYPFFPWGEDGQAPTYDICPCCGVEFGYEDSSVIGVVKFREKWINAGALWSETSLKPRDWNFEEQLRIYESLTRHK